MRALPLLLIAGVVLASPALAAEQHPLAVAKLVHPDGSSAGTARIVARANGAALEVEIAGVPPGKHGLHLHAVGKCEGPDFASAGPHLNPDNHQHGADNPAGSHLGDLPNVTAGDDGRIKATIGTAMAPLALARQLFDADGTAIVLHASADDYLTDPSGNSGARIACGVLERG